MHFITSLIIFCGFAFVVCLGLFNVISDLSEMSVHESPHVPLTADSTNCQAEGVPAHMSDLSRTTKLRDSL
jgi:hypothetical protein